MIGLRADLGDARAVRQVRFVLLIQQSVRQHWGSLIAFAFGSFQLVLTLFTTSLTTSVVSRDLGFHFSKSVHTFPSAQTHWFLRESNGLYFSMICIQPHGSARFLHHCGGVAHQTSLRSRSIMMCCANSPPMGRRAAYSVDPVTALQDHC